MLILAILIFYISIILFIVLVLLIISFLISYKGLIVRDKLLPFECGFDPLLTRHISFFISFYLFSLIFLVFDVEIVLLFPVIVVLRNLNLSYISLLLFIYFIFLLGGSVLVE